MFTLQEIQSILAETFDIEFSPFNTQEVIFDQLEGVLADRAQLHGTAATYARLKHYCFDPHGPKGNQVQDLMNSEGCWLLFLRHFKELADMP